MLHLTEGVQDKWVADHHPGGGGRKELDNRVVNGKTGPEAVRKWPCENGICVPPSACQEGGWLHTKGSFVKVQ